MTWFRYEPGEEGPDPHVHRQHTDAFYVLEGELEVGLGPDVTWMSGGPGSFFGAPPNVVHTFRNASDATTIFLNLHAPSSGFGEVLRTGRHDGFDQWDPPDDGGRPLADAIAAPTGEGERIGRGERAHVVKAELDQLSVIEMTFDPGWEGVDPHAHDDLVDSFYVLDGEVEFLAGDTYVRGGPGTFFAAPRNARHGFRNPTDSPIRVLNIHAPDAGFVGRLRD